jgi:hypothetical protein
MHIVRDIMTRDTLFCRHLQHAPAPHSLHELLDLSRFNHPLVPIGEVVRQVKVRRAETPVHRVAERLRRHSSLWLSSQPGVVVVVVVVIGGGGGGCGWWRWRW